MATLERTKDVFTLSNAVVTTGFDYLGVVEEDWVALSVLGTPIIVFSDAYEAVRVLQYLDSDGISLERADVDDYIEEALMMCQVTHKTIRP
ncbi:hypothetical protein PAB09_09330 [Corynebacterium sp. SCR221107]|uniref:hypothetical protein n=1 Tax=Corynebacterium sp. SCR221107 TaxID=3017361 RepID=UPI0022EC1DA9|nr:hypothetical protein [Corynebacterium sp. SCR221107]WBT08096.1 hypothetical protein PAB09_09330 [Corynebacterium sp. SCR221107]